MVKKVSLVATGLPLALATYLYFSAFEKGTSALQLVERFDWIQLGYDQAGNAHNAIQYFIGVDGISLPFIFLAAVLTVLCVSVSWTAVGTRVREFYAALLVAEILTEAGVPPGVMNVIPSRRAGEVVSAMLHHPAVRKLSFTGSTEVGRGLLKEAADCVVNCSMELGGNAPFLVFDDADIDAAVAGAMIAKMRNGGEACTAANRFYAHERVYDEFAEKFSAAMAAFKVGPGLEPGVELGPMVNEWAIKDMDALVQDAMAKGAEVLTGGAPLERTGYYYPPTVLGHVPADANILREEVFGPVAPLNPTSP